MVSPVNSGQYAPKSKLDELKATESGLRKEVAYWIERNRNNLYTDKISKLEDKIISVCGEITRLTGGPTANSTTNGKKAGEDKSIFSNFPKTEQNKENFDKKSIFD